MIRRILLLLLFGVAANTAFAGRSNNPKVVIETNFGDIGIELYADRAPITADNFLQYVTTGFYDALLFHRIVKGFVIQGGGYYVYQGTLYSVQRGEPIVNESYNGLSNLRGTIAMARTSDPNSATSEFYINQVDNIDLDRAEADDGFGYCVFGRVLSGMDVVDAIAEVPTENIGYGFTHFPYPMPVYIARARVAPPGYWLSADLNNDGIVNFEDYAVLTSSGLAGGEDIALLAEGWLQTTDWYQP
jgi:cyclophilin family peptidyl-prolyl cis-trans isomerase